MAGQSFWKAKGSLALTLAHQRISGTRTGERHAARSGHLCVNQLPAPLHSGHWKISGPEMRIYVSVSKMATFYGDPWQDHGELVAKSLIIHPKG